MREPGRVWTQPCCRCCTCLLSERRELAAIRRPPSQTVQRVCPERGSPPGGVYCFRAAVRTPCPPLGAVGVQKGVGTGSGSGGGCPPLECWFVREKPGEGLKHERTLLHVRTSPDSRSEETLAEPSSSSSSSDVVPDRVYHVT
ncbi:unnamed protein product, partial [Gadus morhua 'NCC']